MARRFDHLPPLLDHFPIRDETCVRQAQAGSGHGKARHEPEIKPRLLRQLC